MMAAQPRTGFVYVVQESKRRSGDGLRGQWRRTPDGILRSGLVKIGFTSKAPEQRFSDLARTTRRQITAMVAFRGTTADERRFHDRLSAFRAKTKLGREWFRPSPEIQFFVDGFRMGCPL